jgi:hypothetical protein
LINCREIFVLVKTSLRNVITSTWPELSIQILNRVILQSNIAANWPQNDDGPRVRSDCQDPPIGVDPEQPGKGSSIETKWRLCCRYEPMVVKQYKHQRAACGEKQNTCTSNRQTNRPQMRAHRGKSHAQAIKAHVGYTIEACGTCRRVQAWSLIPEK